MTDDKKNEPASRSRKQAEHAAWELFGHLSESASTGKIVQGYSYVLIPYFTSALELAFESGVREGIERVARELEKGPEAGA